MKSRASSSKHKSRQESTPGRKKSGSKLLLFLMFLFVIIVIISTWVIVYVKTAVIAVYDVNLTLEVGDYVGFNLDKDKIHMGTVFPGGYSYRDVSLTSSEEGYFYITDTGNFTEWLSVSSQNLKINEGVMKIVTFTAWPGKDAKEGEYETTLKIYTLKRKDSWFTRTFIIEGQPLQLTSERNANPPSGGAKISLNISHKNLTPSQ
ncbi:MAG: hypothetical protein ACP5N3_00995 [Candidatus Nanoarchaeia archaeon]